jgi:hypothetical protein
MRYVELEDLGVDELRDIYSAQNPFVTSPTPDYAALRIDRMERAFRRIERQIPGFVGVRGRLKSRPEVTDAEDAEEGTFSSHDGRVLRCGNRDHLSQLDAGWRSSPSLNHPAVLAYHEPQREICPQGPCA